MECSRRAQAENLLKTVTFVDRPVHVRVHKTLKSSRGVIRCRELSVLSEVEIRDELKTQGVVEVQRVTVKKEGKLFPTNTLFLTFNRSDMPKEIKVGYLTVKVACVYQTRCDVLTATSLTTQASVAKQQQIVNGWER